MILKKNLVNKKIFSSFFLLLSINVGLLCIPPGQMCDDVFQALKQIGPDNELDYFADWGNLARENFPGAVM
jgi:hypothetical protein